MMESRVRSLLVPATTSVVLLAGCSPSEPNELDKLRKVEMTIKGQAFELWVADSSAERDRGLMFITRDQMAELPDGTRRGMLFVFDHELRMSFWMKNTLIPLDIAYINAKGEVVSVHTMAPLDERPWQYPSGAPAQFAIEVNANVFVNLGLTAGETVEIPTSALKGPG